MLEPLWWLLFFTALGLCIGSFLNAVIYRLPRNCSLCEPLWSFCPHCRHRIRWYDNLPILSFILLRGRCRQCDAPISTQYLVIETICALIVLLLLDAFFIGQTRAGISDSIFGLSDRLATDWPILLAHIILFACLLPMSVIDLEHYWVDIRFTNFATVAGFVLHSLWTPKHSDAWVRPADTLGVVSLMVVAALGLTWVVVIVFRHSSDSHEAEAEAGIEAEPPVPAPPISPRRPPPSLMSPSRAGGWCALVVLVTLLALLLVHESGVVQLRHVGRALPPLGLFFVLIVCAASVVRPSDTQIVEAIHRERHGARRMVLWELGLFLPAILGGVVGYLLMTRTGLGADASQAIHARLPVPGGLAMFRHWTPLSGLATAATGYVIAGAIGWAVRILFTLLFGKEAFGTGDIHLMAAAGCIAGWPVVLLGFFLTCGVALVGWVAVLPFKRSRALPLGPWLSVSFLTVTCFLDSILQWDVVQRTLAAWRMLFFENSQPRMLGILS